MKLRSLICETAIIVPLQGATRDAVVAELIDALLAAGAAPGGGREEMLKAVIKREKKGSTGFGHGVAVPHVRLPGATRATAAIGVSHAGVDFKALDRAPVHGIFLLVSPEKDPTAHLDAMETLFAGLGNDRFRRFLRQARGPADVLTLLEDADEGALVP